MAQAIGSYGERFTGIEARFNGIEARIDTIDFRLDALSADMDRRFDAVAADMDRRFNAQTLLMTVLGELVLFGEPIRSALGL